jgi:hypothetical protein
MTYNRIYENIYTFPVNTKGTIVGDNVKVFFDSCPEIQKKTLKAISLSYDISVQNGAYPDQAFITLKNSKGEVLIYNYPANDLNDTVNGALFTTQVFRLRLFNLYDVDLSQSYYFFNNVSGPIGNNSQIVFNFNFYLD